MKGDFLMGRDASPIETKKRVEAEERDIKPQAHPHKMVALSQPQLDALYLMMLAQQQWDEAEALIVQGANPLVGVESQEIKPAASTKTVKSSEEMPPNASNALISNTDQKQRADRTLNHPLIAGLKTPLVQALESGQWEAAMRLAAWRYAEKDPVSGLSVLAYLCQKKPAVPHDKKFSAQHSATRTVDLYRGKIKISKASEKNTHNSHNSDNRGDTKNEDALLKALLEAGANPNLASDLKAHSSPLLLCLKNGESHRIPLLLKHGALPYVPGTKLEASPLWWSIRHDQRELTQLFLDHMVSHHLSAKAKIALKEELIISPGSDSSGLAGLPHGESGAISSHDAASESVTSNLSKDTNNKNGSVLESGIENRMEGDSEEQEASPISALEAQNKYKEALETLGLDFHVLASLAKARGATDVFFSLFGEGEISDFCQEQCALRCQVCTSLNDDQDSIVTEFIQHIQHAETSGEPAASLLLQAIGHQRDSISIALVKHGADVNEALSDWNHLHLEEADKKQRASWLKRLNRKKNVSKDAAKDSAELTLITPLMLATQSDSPAIVKVLLDFGADVHQKDERGNTALHWAARNLDLSCFWILWDYGASLRAPNAQGKSSLDLLQDEPVPLREELDESLKSTLMYHRQTGLQIAKNEAQSEAAKGLFRNLKKPSFEGSIIHDPSMPLKLKVRHKTFMKSPEDQLSDELINESEVPNLPSPNEAIKEELNGLKSDLEAELERFKSEAAQENVALFKSGEPKPKKVEEADPRKNKNLWFRPVSKIQNVETVTREVTETSKVSELPEPVESPSHKSPPPSRRM